MEAPIAEPWITMSDFCQVHQIKLVDFKAKMIDSRLAEIATINCDREVLVPTSETVSRNIARKAIKYGKGKKSHNHSTWRWRNAYISKVFKVELKSLNAAV